MNQVFTFGFKLAELTKQNEAASIGLIGLAIKDAGKNPQQMGLSTKLSIKTAKARIAFSWVLRRSMPWPEWQLA